MKTNKEVLSSVIKTAQMGQVGIRAVLPYAVRQDLKDALRSQQDEYNMIERQAYEVASSRGWELNTLQPGAKTMAKLCTRCMLMGGHCDSKIAAMMINGNTRGMIKGLKNLHHGKVSDNAIQTLAHKLLDFESANIRQMQGYV